MRQSRYSVDLSRQQAECEVNFLRLMKLMPDLDTVDERLFDVTLTGHTPARIHLRVIERCPYTTMIELLQLQGHNPWTPRAQFSLRVYHDARMVEVESFRRQKPRHGHYDYPNHQMFHRDEKAQVNSFLGEWLSHCLNHGYEVVDLSIDSTPVP